jgi:N-acetyl-anhydromuramyl-L-alanine amidase AmpD
VEFQNLSTYNEFKTVGVSNIKKQIILTDSKRGYKNYINSLIYRYNKKNLYLPHYLITKDGEVFQFIEPESYTNYMDNEDVNRFGIIISLENYNWLKKNPLEDTYVNWIGDIYKQKAYEKKWRDHFFWDPYTDVQLEKLSLLIAELCEKFNIPKKCLGNNVKHDDVEYFKGVVTRSNYDFIYKDVNPSFNFKRLEELLENE